MAHNKNKLTHCSNCGYEFNGPDNFCPDCGQENHDIRLPMKHHMHEVIEGLLHLDSKSLRTFFYLVVKPGMLSREFNSGRRVKFVPPVRLYIFISFVFFFLISTGKIIHNESPARKENGIKMKFFTSSTDRLTKEEHASLTKAQIDSLQKYRSQVTSEEVAGMTVKQIDSLLTDKKLGNNWFNKMIFRQLAKAGGDGTPHLFKLIQKNVSYGMFLLMPFIGFLFYIFYRKTGSYYIESLVISIHYHCVIFLIFSFVILADKFFDFWTGYLGAFFLVPVYLYIMLKKYYRQKAFITFVKTISIGTIHFVSALIFYLLITFITLMLL